MSQRAEIHYVCRIILALLILILSRASYASEEWTYTSFPFVAAVKEDHLPAELRVGRSTLRPLMPKGSATHPLWGVDQVYTVRGFFKKLIVKRGVKLSQSQPVGGWSAIGHGHVLHLMRAGEITAFYAIGFDNQERLQIDQQLRASYKKLSLQDLFAPRAQAEETYAGSKGPLTAPALAGSQDFASTGNGENLAICIGRMTAENVKSAAVASYEGAKSVVTSAYSDPMGAAKAAGSYLYAAGGAIVNGAESGAAYVGEALHDPKKIYSDVSAALDKTREMGEALFKQTATSVPEFISWPQPIKNTVICAMAGKLAAAGLLAAATALSGVGVAAGTVRLLALLKTVFTTLKDASAVIKLIIAATKISGAERLSLISDLVKGKKSIEEARAVVIEAQGGATVVSGASSANNTTTAVSGATNGTEGGGSGVPSAKDPNAASGARDGAGSVKETATDGPKTEGVKGASNSSLTPLQAKNISLSDTDRLRAIENQLGLRPGSLEADSGQGQKLLALHRQQCAALKCTAQEIKSLKGLKDVRAMFPQATPEQLKGLYRNFLLGGEKGDESEFADLLKQMLRAQPTSAQVEGDAELALREGELVKANQAVARLASDPNHSPIEMAEAQRQQGLIQKDVDSLHLKRQAQPTDAPPSAQEMADLKPLLKQSLKPTAERSVPDSVAEEEAHAARAKAAERMLQHDNEAKIKTSAAPRELSEAEKKELFESVLKQKFNPSSQLSPLEKATRAFEDASPSRPAPARYISSVTGAETKGEVIGFDTSAGAGVKAKAFLRTTTEDGRVVTRKVSLEDIAMDGQKKTLGDLESPQTGDDIADKLIKNQNVTRARIQKLDEEERQARASGNGDLTASIQRMHERTDLEKMDAPLAQHEIEAIDAVTRAFSKENLPKRIPMSVTPTGSIATRGQSALARISHRPCGGARNPSIASVIRA